jgi:perosamine synthetase
MLRFVPPAGAPLKIAQILRAWKVADRGNGTGQECLRSVTGHLQVKYVFGASSGRAALWLILRSLQRLHPERNVVAIPAYTCFSVAAAVVRTGLKIYPVEIDPHTLDFDFSQLDAVPGEKLLCIIPSNLFGLLNDLPRIRQAAQAKDAFVLDDAAQALGATRNGQFAGTEGDVGLYSLGRGKAVTTIEGGLIVTNSEEIARLLEHEAKDLEPQSRIHGAGLLLKMLIYSVLLNPRLYWMPNSVPFLGLGVTEFDPAFRTEELPDLCRALLPTLLNEMAKINQVRRSNAAAIMRAVAGNCNFEFPSPVRDSHPSFVRLPVIARNKETAKMAIRRLHKAGIGAGASYPSAICDIPGIAEHMSVKSFHRPEAEFLSERLLTLPVHPLVGAQDLSRMADILNSL